MNRKIPVQPFNYGKVRKGRVTKQMGACDGEKKDATLEQFSVDLQRATAFSD